MRLSLYLNEFYFYKIHMYLFYLLLYIILHYISILLEKGIIRNMEFQCYANDY